MRARVLAAALACAQVGLSACAGGGPARNEADTTAERMRERGDSGTGAASSTPGAAQATAPGDTLDASAAVAAFRAAWRDAVRARTAAVDSSLVSLVESGAPSTERLPCRDVAARVRETLGTGLAAAVLHGSPAALDRDGDCWLLHWDGLRAPGLSAAVDARAGAVLLAWETPEG